MGVATIPVSTTPFEGIDAETNLVRLAPTKCQNALNNLFQAASIIARPGLASTTFTGVNGQAAFVDNVIDNAVQYSMFIDTSGNIWYNASGISAGQVNGAGTSFGSVQFNNVTAIIGLIVFGNNTGGIITWDPSTLSNNYNVISTAKYRYVCGHQGRAVATYDTSASLLLGPRTYAWSKPGDITTWTSADGSAGSEALADVNDEITGLGVLHNIVVIPRRYGIHLAYPTGTLPLPYNVQSFILKGSGFWYPSTVAWSDEMAIGVGEDNVYLFDLQSMTPIGNSIRTELMTNLFSGTSYRGIITRYGSSFTPRYRYHLAPILFNAAGATHFSYDIKDQTWSRHQYTNGYNWAWNMPSPSSEGLGDFGFAFVDTSNPPRGKYWDTNTPTEQATSLTKYMGNTDDLASDYAVEDVVIHYLDQGAVAVTCTIIGTGSAGTVTTTATASIGNGDGTWKRAFLSRSNSNLRQVGNDFNVTISTPAGFDFVYDQVTLLLTKQGEFRG